MPRRVGRAAEADEGRLLVGALHPGDRLDHDEHVEDPVIEQDAALLRPSAVPRRREVPRLVDDALEALPRALLGPGEIARLLEFGFRGALPLLGSDDLLGEGVRPVVVLPPGHAHARRHPLSGARERPVLRLRGGDVLLRRGDGVRRMRAEDVALLDQRTHFRREVLARALSDDDVLDLGLELLRVHVPRAAALRVHQRVRLRVHPLLGLRVDVPTRRALLLGQASPVVLDTAVRARGRDREQVAPPAAARGGSARVTGESLRHLLVQRHVDHRLPLRLHSAAAAFPIRVGAVRVLQVTDERWVREEVA
ncbi:hypothetical protein tb265_25210 [Gemmatimonadetes bacterium T265]|nr:hypothetical protein tb265_25210 [Gemmatimonadetes bacterium T265]